MIDVFKELERKRSWENGEQDDGMSIEQIYKLVLTGANRCSVEENCISKQICGEDSCSCVRARFPSPESYQLFKLVKEQYEKHYSRKLLDQFVKSLER